MFDDGNNDDKNENSSYLFVFLMNVNDQQANSSSHFDVISMELSVPKENSIWKIFLSDYSWIGLHCVNTNRRTQLRE